MKKSLCFNIEDVKIDLNNLPPHLKELHKEIELCKELRIPYFLVLTPIFGRIPKEEFIVREEKELVPGLKPIRTPVETLAGYEVLLRTNVFNGRNCLEAIANLGGTNVLTSGDMDVIENWPLHVESSYTNRNVGIVRVSELQDKIDGYVVDDKVFAKTKLKMNEGHGKVLSIDEVLRALEEGLPYHKGSTLSTDEDKRGIQEISEEDELLLSQPLNLSRDELGTLEYRTWVVGNRVAIITNYHNPEDFNIPSRIESFTNDFVRQQSGKLPHSYVLDIGIEHSEKRIVVIELNDFMSAGGTNKRVFSEILNYYC
ncbi:MAG: ATP-grasp domain-containing protein [archaeon]